MTKSEWWHMMDDFEGSKLFKIPVNIAFWLSVFAVVVFLFINYRVSLYITAGWCVLIICVYWPLFLKSPIEFIDVIDDPLDDLKHKIHGMTIFGYTIYLPSWLMRNKEDPK